MSDIAVIEHTQLKRIVEAALLAADEPLSLAQLDSLFEDGKKPGDAALRQALAAIDEECADRGIELREVASGWRLQVKAELQEWIARLWTERPARYSRALLETLALIAYRQPITRGEIESVRGVSLSPNIIRTLQEREWIRVVGHRDVPGKPALLGTTKAFLDYFNLQSLDQLPTLSELRDLDSIEPELEFDQDGGEGDSNDAGQTDASTTSAPSDRESAEPDPNERGTVAGAWDERPAGAADNHDNDPGDDPGDDPGNDPGNDLGDDAGADDRDDRGSELEDVSDRDTPGSA